MLAASSSLPGAFCVSWGWGWCLADVSDLFAGLVWLWCWDLLFVWAAWLSWVTEGLGGLDEPESLILAQSERWRHA